MHVYDDKKMQMHLAEQVEEILKEQRRSRHKRRRPLLKKATQTLAVSALLAGLLTLILIRAFAAGEIKQTKALPEAVWTSPVIDVIHPNNEALVLTQESEPEYAPLTVTVHSRYAAISDEDIDLIARIVHLESNNQPFEGQQAVAEVILNRIWADNFPDTASEVIYSPGQFTTAQGAAYAVPTLENYMAVLAALYGEPITPLDVVYFNGVPESQNIWAQIGDHVFCRQYPWACSSGQYNDSNREARTMAMKIYNWSVSHPEYGTINVTAINRFYAVMAAAQDWGIYEKSSLFAECDVEQGSLVMSVSEEDDHA